MTCDRELEVVESGRTIVRYSIGQITFTAYIEHWLIKPAMLRVAYTLSFAQDDASSTLSTTSSVSISWNCGFDGHCRGLNDGGPWSAVKDRTPATFSTQ